MPLRARTRIVSLEGDGAKSWCVSSKRFIYYQVTQKQFSFCTKIDARSMVGTTSARHGKRSQSHGAHMDGYCGAAIFSPAPHATVSLSLRNHLGLWHVLVGDVHLDRARRCVGEILVAMDGAARNIDPVAHLEHARCLALDRIGDLALLDRPPLLARMAMELIARARGNDDILHPYLPRRVLLERHLKIHRRPELRLRGRRLRPRHGRDHA